MTEDMKSSGTSSSSSVTTGNCRSSIESVAANGTGTMHSTTTTDSPLPDASPAPPPPPPSLPPQPPSLARRLSPKDISNSEFVNRLLAATRITDFYSANVAPHSFFYSEMLRSLVQNRASSEAAAAQVERESHHQATQQSFNSLPLLNHQHRRNRKRMWPNRFAELRAANGVAEASIENNAVGHETELKLEKIRKREDKGEFLAEKEQKIKSPLSGLVPEKTGTNMVFPTTNTTPWYSPYPPFFIDLRVSGHIYDDTKPKLTVPAPPGNLDPKAIRQGSAFTVPQSRSAMAPMNLTTNQTEISLFKQRIMAKERFSPQVDGYDQERQETREDEDEGKEQRGVFPKGQFDEEVIAVDDS